MDLSLSTKISPDSASKLAHTLSYLHAQEAVGPVTVLEIGMELTPTTLCLLEGILQACGIAYYVEPLPSEPYMDLSELESACEGK